MNTQKIIQTRDSAQVKEIANFLAGKGANAIVLRIARPVDWTYDRKAPPTLKVPGLDPVDVVGGSEHFLVVNVSLEFLKTQPGDVVIYSPDLSIMPL